MVKIIMIYTSMTGNTEEMAELIAEGIREQGWVLDMKEVMDADVSELQDYEGILLGAYTWGDGELPDEFIDFYEEMKELDLTGKRAAVFGSCDSAYEKFGAAVDILTERLAELGANLVLKGLKVELAPSGEERETCKQFGRNFVIQLSTTA
ncbi:flavodoxin [Laceyella putida]|uniref:Flavodoxin n=1 Tax=Laceyella putida TaxID=110101 RepID=A0ABW2RHJ8_9BACL